jgi:hypothetical protein
MGRRLGKRVGGSVYGRIGVWGTKTAFRHDYDDQEVSKKLTTLCKRRHADSPICSPIRCGGCEGEAVSQNPFLQNEGEVWQNDEPKCGRSNGHSGFWKDYEDMICNTATDDAPWYVVPADNKWFTRVVVAAVVIDALESLDLRYPEIGEAQRQELAVAKKELTATDNL